MCVCEYDKEVHLSRIYFLQSIVIKFLPILYTTTISITLCICVYVCVFEGPSTCVAMMKRRILAALIQWRRPSMLRDASTHQE